MNWFEFLFFFILTSGLIAILKLKFFIVFSDARHKKYYYAIYLVFTYGIGLTNQWLQSYWITTILNMFLLIGVGYFLLKVSLPNAVLTSILSECVMSLAFGMINSTTALISPVLIPINFVFGSYMAISIRSAD